LIAETRDPEGLAVLPHAQRIVFENFDPGRTQSLAHPLGIIGWHARQSAMPPIVVSENRMDAERRF